MLKVLFVCLGNICRSPLAEGIFASLVEQKKLNCKISCDSAGTGDWHIGETADPRMIKTASEHGINLTHKARQIKKSDFHDFDYVLVMDRSVMEDLKKNFIPANPKSSILYMREYDDTKMSMDVPDPWYGGEDGFEVVFQLLDKSVNNFLEFLILKHKIEIC
ncbi:MAG: hypothetical protein A3H98_14420 [Bacteroidetes bacterium RIFCSPLOWO2_02_FULL_36_8]|nr:MAG: hypothetical protein A3H98_14420 [Bacteroidetes bacterium RIFCSPLOWO2_02_FULL_36_8]OFY71781.1 MAG: hypothetical protein A3G23_13770 [Bacteroidetes bacterium RIFCSPLOWO2_12_FULL_37_12]